MSPSPTLGALALLPAMLGPLPQDHGHPSLLLALCGDGMVEVSLQGGNDAPAPAMPAMCCAKGCHTGQRRRLLDRGQ